MLEYRAKEIEKKWQEKWEKDQTYLVEDNQTLPKYYILDMFPYPSGEGLHVGHPLGYIASDIVSRYKKHLGFNVLHPMGYDSFGLPAEQFAIQTGKHPSLTTQTNIKRYRQQLNRLGFSFDWNREIQKSDPLFYKWSQKFFIMMLLFSTNVFSATIGDVILQEGSGIVERKDGGEFSSKIDLDIFSYDTVKTGKGKTAIEFVDDTRVDVTEHSKLLIDEFVYDPNTKTGALSLKASLGTVRYASGQIAKNSKQNVIIKTPTATIGVRGTDFSMTIDETGSSTIILLPSCDTSGNCYVGEIDVTSDAGQVIMNQAFQATVVETVSSRPMKPVTLDIDENLIGNLLIISKPREIEEQQTKERYAIIADALDLDFLEFEELDVDYLEEETENWATGLDIDFLEQNFLADILEQINKQLALQMRNEFDKEKTRTEVRLGKDPETGITLLDEDPDWLWSREDAAGNKIELRLNKEHGYILNITQQDFEIIDYEIGGVENDITIYQAQ